MNKNRECAFYAIAVIRAVMQEKPVPTIPENLSLQELYEFAKLHNVESLMYYGLLELDPDPTDPVWRNWENRANMLLAQSVVQLSERDALFAALTSAGIPLLPFKGCWLKELYPNMEYRQMADLDMLIPRDRAVFPWLSARGHGRCSEPCRLPEASLYGGGAPRFPAGGGQRLL